MRPGQRTILAIAVLSMHLGVTSADEVPRRADDVLVLRWAERDIEKGIPSEHLILNSLTCLGTSCEMVALRFSPCIRGSFSVYPTVMGNLVGELKVQLPSEGTLLLEYASAGTTVVYRIEYRKLNRPLSYATVQKVWGSKITLGRATEVLPVGASTETSLTTVDLLCSKLAIPGMRVLNGDAESHSVGGPAGPESDR